MARIPMHSQPEIPAFRSEEALIGMDVDLRIVCWNEAAEWLTGMPADEVLGKCCCPVRPSMPEAGKLLLQAACRDTRLARKGSAVPRRRVLLPDGNGGRRVTMTTVVVAAGGRPVFLHVARNGADAGLEAVFDGPVPTLTPRQRQVLELLADGVPAKVIAAHLGISLITARNHIHAVLVELRSHSQLEAIARARKLGLV